MLPRRIIQSPFAVGGPHPIHRRYYAEDLVRLRRSSEKRRYAASQRRGRIDPNPHQIDAVMFALRRIPEGGCILADEVGLGKTIEAGLVIAQLLAEGASRILIIVPRPLLGQWQDELFSLFGLQAREAALEHVDTTLPGVYLVGREFAGGQAGAAKLAGGPPFDLCVIDEAHEVFAGIHKRYDRHGSYNSESKHAQTAHRVRQLIGVSPVLLLTATPIQNSLVELWGLVQYVEPTGTLLGTLPTFKTLFCDSADGRVLVPEQTDELRRRLNEVVQRTLRRQAGEFLERPFVGRSALLFEYEMSADERALYDDVTRYLLEPNLCAFQGRGRQLLLLGFHRRMASSKPALAKSLENVAERLRGQQAGAGATDLDAAMQEVVKDLEDDSPLPSDKEPPVQPAPSIATELARVESFIVRARSLPADSKADSLIRAVRSIADRQGGSRKVVVFTESLTTQDYLVKLLVERAGLSAGEVTVFRGTNDSKRAEQALARWKDEVGSRIPAHARPSPDIAVRLALVHEFKTRSRVFVSTEAGAKGLNLQFCDTIINYDLPWNPQRIEQRIGRCHRYGQTRDVTVVNFLAKDNAAQRLTFEILSKKLDLFGEVLDMSDQVLHAGTGSRAEELATALGADFEAQLGKIWDRARSLEEVEDELRRLGDSIEERKAELDQIRRDTVGLIESRLDESVRQVFRQIRDELPTTLAEFDAELLRVASNYLEAIDVPFQILEEDGRRFLSVDADRRLPGSLSYGFRAVLGHAEGLEDAESLHVGHPLLEAAVDEARRAGIGTFSVTFRLTDTSPDQLRQRIGARGRLAVSRVLHSGFEREERLVVTALFEDAMVLKPADVATALVHLPCEARAPLHPPLRVTLADLDEVVDEELFFDQSTTAAAEHARFMAAMEQLDQFIEDRVLVLRRTRVEKAAALENAEQRRDAALGRDARATREQSVARLETELEELDAMLQRLNARDDADFVKWKDHAHRRRYHRPTAERLFDVEFVIDA